MLNLHEHHFPSACDHECPPKPRFTLHEDMEKTIGDMNHAIGRMLDFERQLNEKVECMLSHITADNVTFKNTFNEAYRAFLESVRTEVNGFEGDMTNSFRLFTTTIESNYSSLSAECKAQITEYYNDVILFIKTNINGALTEVLEEMQNEGSLDGVIQSHVFVTPNMYGARGDGVTDDTAAFKNMLSAKKNIYIPAGDYILSESLDFTGLNVDGSVDAYLYFTNTSGDGVVCGYGSVRNINLVMRNEFTGALLKVDEGAVNNYPDRSTIENVNLYSQNNACVGTFVHIKPYNNYGGLFEKIKIGRMSKKINTQINKAKRGVYVEVGADCWATGYVFRDILIDAHVSQPLTVTAPDYYHCMNIVFENVQIQNKHNSIGFTHEYMARFKGVQDLYLLNCKVWDFSYDYTTHNVIYADCTNVVVRNSPVFDRYFNENNPFLIEGSAMGLEENVKLYNSERSVDGGYTGMCESVEISGDNTYAIPYLIPHKFEQAMYSKLTAEVWSRLDYSHNSGDTYLRIELMQTNYCNNILYLNNAPSMPIVKKIKKYKEGVVIWLRGGCGAINFSYTGCGKVRNVANQTLTTWEGASEKTNAEVWDGTTVPICKTLTVLNTREITSETSVK